MFTVLHAGGKFDKKSYGFSGGLHGVGVSVTNALSKTFCATIRRDGKEHGIEFRDGELSKALHVIRAAPKDSTGTTVHFLYDNIVVSIGVDPHKIVAEGDLSNFCGTARSSS